MHVNRNNLLSLTKCPRRFGCIKWRKLRNNAHKPFKSQRAGFQSTISHTAAAFSFQTSHQLVEFFRENIAANFSTPHLLSTQSDFQNQSLRVFLVLHRQIFLTIYFFPLSDFFFGLFCSCICKSRTVTSRHNKAKQPNITSCKR